eukprot:g62867.t1
MVLRACQITALAVLDSALCVVTSSSNHSSPTLPALAPDEQLTPTSPKAFLSPLAVPADERDDLDVSPIATNLHQGSLSLHSEIEFDTLPGYVLSSPSAVEFEILSGYVISALRSHMSCHLMSYVIFTFRDQMPCLEINSDLVEFNIQYVCMSISDRLSQQSDLVDFDTVARNSPSVSRSPKRSPKCSPHLRSEQVIERSPPIQQHPLPISRSAADVVRDVVRDSMREASAAAAAGGGGQQTTHVANLPETLPDGLRPFPLGDEGEASRGTSPMPSHASRTLTQTRSATMSWL